MDVLTGDTVHLRPGARVAVDGVVLSGQTFIDESMISGEPVPVSKAADDTVIGGTVNATGALTYRATAVGADMVLSQIIRMVEDAKEPNCRSSRLWTGSQVYLCRLSWD